MLNSTIVHGLLILTDHVTHHNEWFSSFEYFKTPIKIYIGNKSTMDALGKGTIKFEAMINGKWLPCYIENVLYVPTARRNLFSVTSALDKVCRLNHLKMDINSQGILSRHETFELLNCLK